ncbi:MAG TPA: hypothetical protein VFT62_07315 [Mycobacteriales bacterium]|nr:hypothetical protein [Mycobacteriales bacterium]
MSATAPLRPDRASRATPRPAHRSRPPLRLVIGGPLTAGRTPFALLVGAILGVGLVALLLLHTLAAQDAFQLQELQHRSAQLDDAEQQLALAQQQREAPDALAARARALGMVPTGSLAFVRLHGHHGRIVGVAKAAVPPPAPPAASKPVTATTPGSAGSATTTTTARTGAGSTRSAATAKPGSGSGQQKAAPATRRGTTPPAR